MAKVRIGAERFEYDFDRLPLSDALALEKALKTTYGQWIADRQAGSARAIAGLIWLIWKRNGKDIDFAQIESGEVVVDLADYEIETPAEEPDPTTSPSTREASAGISESTSGRSRKS